MQFLAYILIYPFLWLISILPFRLLYLFSDGIYILIYHIIGYRKKTVKENLHLVFPDKSNKEIKTITKTFYHHLCDMIVESIKSMTISEAEMKKRFVIKNVDQILELEKENKSIVLMCGHYASWEWIFILQRHINHKGYAIYKRLANKYFDALVKRIRAKYNSYLITTKETFTVLMAAKKKGELTINGFAADQSPKHDKAFHWQEFMNIKVPVHTGAELLAKKLDMAVVFLKVKKLKRGYYEATIETITKTPREYKDYDITDIFLKRLEAQIYEAPEYYLWTHKRWKHRDKVPENFR
ncbi:MAG: lipid A biosynthesis acyltransferase [Xanthomarina sp.]|jgi:KDO2-lipid IV(A) lauroyltransferase|uniref:Lipid A biosynthesis lauroyl acyltransferase n=1 Tax=Xanthomarina gelatinilytica TaxID=1137281 RepID=M7MGW6_9FLAO|nr:MULTISPECIES: lysophospholipid acyltransferase family protein [Xanthomarina]EMQ94306.1 Lipid A biosynthesis lauroyl acyltransferase [Xanthomarina gelatinilytica]MAL23001.1 lipid A biosynthesis acyltransferase [Xanthomarina sp.]MBF62452.1 lipid A biosynthesis acyltransferase [Xanthomarina sp.]